MVKSPSFLHSSVQASKHERIQMLWRDVIVDGCDEDGWGVVGSRSA
jgi:hypothetical protein